MEEIISIVCVLNQRKRGIYSVEWVQKLKNMVDKHINRPYLFFCFTNMAPDPHINDIIWLPLRYKWLTWWAKMEIFSPIWPLTQHPEMILSDRVLYLDLDILVVGDLEPFIEYPAEFAIGSAYGHPQIHHKRRVRGVRRGYNSSVMAFNRGPITDCIWSKFTRSPHRWMELFRGDQDFIKNFFPDLAKFPSEWIPKLGSCINDDDRFEPQKDAKIVLCMERNMKKKNLDAITKYPEVAQIWG